MLKLIVRLALLLGGVGLLGGLGLWLGLRRGYVDAFYARFTAPPAASLILGSSRAAQGIKPSALVAKLGGRYAGPWLNYAFTLAESPYGPGYLSSIKRKLAPGTRNGLFILAVDPWALSLPNDVKHGEYPLFSRFPGAGKPLIFPEAKSMVSQLASVSQNPNLGYLAHYLHKPFYQLLLPIDTAQVIERLHPDGWLEIALPPPSANPDLLRRRTAGKLSTYRVMAVINHLAEERLASLRETIIFLQAHGQVVLVRLPTSPEMAALESQFQPSFNRLLASIAHQQNVPYLSYLSRPYPTNDGNHITRAAAEQFSQQLAEDIRQMGK